VGQQVVDHVVRRGGRRGGEIGIGTGLMVLDEAFATVTTLDK
jgi:hypothetical protein